MAVMPVTFIFSGSALTDPVAAAPQVDHSLEVGDPESALASLQVAEAGFAVRQIENPDFGEALNAFASHGDSPSESLRSLDPLHWRLGMHAVGAPALSSRRFISRAEMLTHVRSQMAGNISVQDENGRTWELLGLKFAERLFQVLLKERSDNPACVEIHVDSHMAPYTRKALHEIYSEAARIVAKRAGVGEILLIINGSQARDRVDDNIENFVKAVFNGIIYTGKITVVRLQERSVQYYHFKSVNGGIRHERNFFAVGDPMPLPPRLYLERVDPSLEDMGPIGTAEPQPPRPSKKAPPAGAYAFLMKLGLKRK